MARQQPVSPSLTITTLKQRADFLRLRHGRKYTTPYFIMRYAAADVPLEEAARVGYTVTTKCGNAVVRNRIKRRLRALVHELAPTGAKAQTDYIIIALAKVTPSAADVPYEQLREAVRRSFAASHRI